MGQTFRENVNIDLLAFAESRRLIRLSEILLIYRFGNFFWNWRWPSGWISGMLFLFKCIFVLFCRVVMDVIIIILNTFFIMTKLLRSSPVEVKIYHRLRARKALTILPCSVENQKVYGDSALLVLNETLLNNVNSLPVVNNVFFSPLQISTSSHCIVVITETLDTIKAFSNRDLWVNQYISVITISKQDRPIYFANYWYFWGRNSGIWI